MLYDCTPSSPCPATGILKGYDQLLNLVLDGTVEYLQGMCMVHTHTHTHTHTPLHLTIPTDPEDPFKLTDETRSLGLVVCRGTAVVLICPSDSMEQIANPFLQAQDEV